MGTIYEKMPFGPAPSSYDRHAWGIWDKRQKCWMLRPRFADEAIDEIAEALREVYAAGLGDSKIRQARDRLARSRLAARTKPPSPATRPTRLPGPDDREPA